MPEEKLKTSEAIGLKPPTNLKQVMDMLKKRSEREADPDILIRGTIARKGDVILIISPIKPIFDIDSLNIFAKGIFEQLRSIKTTDAPEFMEAKSQNKKGGIVYPEIVFGKEIMGSQTVTPHINVSDPVNPDEIEPYEIDLIRKSTRVRICISPETADLVYKVMNRENVPYGEESSYTLRTGISEERLQKLRENNA